MYLLHRQIFTVQRGKNARTLTADGSSIDVLGVRRRRDHPDVEFRTFGATVVVQVGSRYTVTTASQPVKERLHENREDEWFDVVLVYRDREMCEYIDRRPTCTLKRLVKIICKMLCLQTVQSSQYIRCGDLSDVRVGYVQAVLPRGIVSRLLPPPQRRRHCDIKEVNRG